MHLPTNINPSIPTFMLSRMQILKNCLCLVAFVPNFQERISRNINYVEIIKVLETVKVPTVTVSCSVVPDSIDDMLAGIPSVFFALMLLFLKVESFILSFSILLKLALPTFLAPRLLGCLFIDGLYSFGSDFSLMFHTLAYFSFLCILA